MVNFLKRYFAIVLGTLLLSGCPLDNTSNNPNRPDSTELLDENQNLSDDKKQVDDQTPDTGEELSDSQDESQIIDNSETTPSENDQSTPDTGDTPPLEQQTPPVDEQTPSENDETAEETSPDPVEADTPVEPTPEPTPEPEPVPAPPIVIKVSGQVVAPTGLAGVTVTANNLITVSDENGFYEIEGLDVSNQEKLSISFEKDGYTNNQKIIPVSSARLSYGVNATLSKYHFSAWTNASSDSTENIAIVDPADPANQALVNVSFPSGSIPATGQIKVSIARGDPTVTEGRAIFPGDFMGTNTSGGVADTFIESVVFTEITLTDTQGNEITTLNQPATVTLKLPDALQSDYNAGDTIPWWSYDEENAVWLREDADPATEALDDAVIVNEGGILFATAKVSHFSWWNVDKPITEHGCVCSQVENEDSNPVSWVNVAANGVTYNASSTRKATDNNGIACVTVKRSVNVDEREEVEMFAEFGGKRFNYNVTDTEEGNAGSPVIKTPTESGSTIIDNPGVCLELKNKIRIAFDGHINGSVKDDSGTPIINFTFSSDLGDEIKTNGNGEFSYKVPTATPVTLFKSGLFSKTTTATDAQNPAIVNIILPNAEPWIQKLSRNKKGIIANGESVVFDVLAIDPERQALSYSWSIDGGYSLSLGNDNQQATFVTPASGSGVAMITLVVTDIKGATSTEKQIISWGNEIGTSNTLNLIFLNNAEENTPVANILVALHNEAGAITSTVSSDENGVANMGNIGASTATFSVLYQNPIMDCSTTTTDYLQTFVDVPVGNLVFYLHHYLKASPRTERTNSCIMQTLTKYDVAVDQVSGSATGMKIMPSASGKYPLSGTGSESYSGVFLRDTHLKTNGLFDLIGYAYDGSSKIWGYDFVLDQAIDSEQTYNFSLSLNRTALDIPWTKPNAIAGPKLSLNVERMGMSYNLVSRQENGTSGTFSTLPNYPADSYRVKFEKTTKPGYYGERKYNLLPNAFEIPEPANTVSNGLFSGNTFSWTNSGISDINWISMNFSCGIRGLTWNVWLAGTNSSWNVVDVPSAVSSCATAIRDKIGGYNGENTPNHFIAIHQYDYDVLNSRDDLWYLLLTGTLLQDISDMHTSSYYRLQGTGDAP